MMRKLKGHLNVFDLVKLLKAIYWKRKASRAMEAMQDAMEEAFVCEGDKRQIWTRVFYWQHLAEMYTEKLYALMEDIAVDLAMEDFDAEVRSL